MTIKANHRIQLVATDVDGTLLNDDDKISPENLAAIERARAAGVKVTIATGRSHYFLSHVTDQFTPDTPIVAASGSCTVDLAANKMIDFRTLPIEAVEAVIRIAREYETGRFVSLLEYFYFETTASLRDRFNYVFTHEMDIRLSPDVLAEKLIDPIKIAIYNDQRPVLEEISARLKAEVGGLTVRFPTPVFIDVTAAEANKGAALRRLAEREGIPLANILVLGDGNNDVDMFDVAGTSVAMGNAVPELKAAADYIAPTNNENGFAWALNQLLETGS